MRAEARHQLKEDRFSRVTIEAAESAAHWTVEHQSKLIVATIAAVVVIAIAFGGWYYINEQDHKASADFATAVRTFETPVRPAGMPPQEGFESFASMQERATAARKQFQQIVDQYPRTHTAEMARYFVGLTAQQLNDNATAERNLQEVSTSSNTEVASLAKLALAGVYRAEGKDSQATDLYKQLIEKPTTLVSKATAQFQLADYYQAHQKPDEAKKIYDQIAKENPSSEAASLAQRRAAEIKQ